MADAVLRELRVIQVDDAGDMSFGLNSSCHQSIAHLLAGRVVGLETLLEHSAISARVRRRHAIARVPTAGTPVAPAPHADVVPEGPGGELPRLLRRIEVRGADRHPIV